MASQPLMAFALLGLGLRALSVAPRAVPMMKRLVRAVSAADARAAVDEAMLGATAAEVERVLRVRLRTAIAEPALLEDGLLGLDEPGMLDVSPAAP
jgi:signal transduction protein with GAF and PtsI domain